MSRSWFDKRPVSSERRSSCIYSTLSKIFTTTTIISKVFSKRVVGGSSAFYPQSSSRNKKPLPNNLITPSLTFDLSSHSSSSSRTDKSLTAYHESQIVQIFWLKYGESISLVFYLARLSGTNPPWSTKLLLPDTNIRRVHTYFSQI